MNSLLETLIFDWPWRPWTTGLLLLCGLLYTWGWQRSRRAYPLLASPARLALFWTGLLIVALAMISPLFLLREELLMARAAQQILLMLLAPPLLWLSCPFHIVVWGLPPAWRKVVSRRFLRGRTADGRLWRILTRPGLVWMATLAIFLFWHDPQIVSWSLADPWVYSLGLWLILGIYMLFWWHLVGTAPRIHRALPVWMSAIYLLVGGELPNMATGVILAFRETPAYVYYAAQASPYGLTALTDQMTSGGMIWFIGSVIYVIALLAILGRYFNNEDAPPRLSMRWEATERTIAPGLEARVIPEQYRREQEYH
jgi:putative membrane protein